MGAIAGVMPGKRGLDRESLTAALASIRDMLRRRAPIEGGMVVAYDASIALAHRAGEGPGGESVLQPLGNETGTLWLVADGEPSNAGELRLELIGSGHRFRSAYGGEVILHLYEQEGVSGLERLAGGFAFALWDRDQHQLLVGRDRFGEKPLYVAQDGDHFSFASEARALGGSALDPATVTAFLALGYLPEPLTVMPAVRALQPGSILRVRGERVRSERLWKRAFVEPTSTPGAQRVHLGQALREAVQEAVAGEEEVGIVLDGDITRAALLGLARPVLGEGLRTHALSFDSASRPRRLLGCAAGSGLQSRRLLAEWFRSEHCEHRVGPRDMMAAFEAAAQGDQPSANGVLARLTAACVAASGDRVFLSALGGPELLGPSRDGWRPWVWRAGRYGSARAMASAGYRVAARLRPFGRAAAIANCLTVKESLAASYLAARALLAPAALARVVRADVIDEARNRFDPAAYVSALALREPELAGVDLPRSARAAAVRAVAAVERGGQLMSGALRATESAAAGAGLALRMPYLDHRLLERVTMTAASGATSGARALAELLHSTIPRPFSRQLGAVEAPPLDRWMRLELRPLVEAHLFGADPEGFFVSSGIEVLWKSFLHGAAPALPVWSLAALRAWIGAHRSAARAADLARAAVCRRDAA
jgi:asparagine synthetase B (glutamine-hydrolysing)